MVSDLNKAVGTLKLREEDERKARGEGERKEEGSRRGG